MGISNGLINFYSVFTVIMLGIFHCKLQELKIIHIELCENFSSQGICREKLEKEHSYKLKLKDSKRFETWETLSNYLYFHSRQTPGFIVRFNRKFTQPERELFLKTYKATYEFKGFSGHVEGFEVGEDWIGSFQYLGSIVKDRQRHFKEDKNFPKLETVFPAKIEFSFKSFSVIGEIDTNVNLKYLE